MKAIGSARRLAQLIALLSPFLFACAGDIARAQPSFSVTAFLVQEFTSGGVPLFKMLVQVRPFISPDSDILSLVAPDGTVGEKNNFFDRHSVNLHNLSLTAAQSTFSGTWKFTESRGSEEFDYEFTLPQITPELFPETPKIVSHRDGDIVQSGFLLDWAYESGVEILGPSSLLGTNGVASLDRMMIDDTSTKVFFGLQEGISEGRITASVGRTESQPIDILPLSQGANATFAFKSLSITSNSVPIRLRAVPEPATMTLLGLCTLVNMARRKKR